jgi:hypothetical protein
MSSVCQVNQHQMTAFASDGSVTVIAENPARASLVFCLNVTNLLKRAVRQPHHVEIGAVCCCIIAGGPLLHSTWLPLGACFYLCTKTIG